MLFDLDGTLVDSHGLWEEAALQVLREEGLLNGIRREDVAELLRKGHDYLEEILPELNEKELRRMYRKTREYVKERADEVRAILSREEVLAMLNGRPAGLVTSTSRDVVRAFLEPLEMLDLFDVVVARDDVQNTKPHPEPIIRAVEEMGEFECVYVGNTLSDEEAALQAGVDFVHVEAVVRYVRGGHI